MHSDVDGDPGSNDDTDNSGNCPKNSQTSSSLPINRGKNVPINNNSLLPSLGGFYVLYDEVREKEAASTVLSQAQSTLSQQATLQGAY